MVQETSHSDSIVVKVEAADGFLGRHPFGSIVLRAQFGFERPGHRYGEGVEPPGLPVVGPERYLPVQVDQLLGPAEEPRLLFELPAQRRPKVGVLRLDLTAHRHPDPASDRGSPEEEQLEGRGREEIPFDTFPGDRSVGVGH